MDSNPVSLILLIHDPRESSWKVEWVREIKTTNFGSIRVSLETHPANLAECTRCQIPAVDVRETDKDGLALDAFITHLIGGQV